MIITVYGRFPTLNEAIAAYKRQRGSWNSGNALKQKNQKEICRYIPKGTKFNKRIFIQYTFYEPNTRRDMDNISGWFHKVFQDALVQSGCIRDDGWKCIIGMSDYYEVDKKNPRIEVNIQEEV